MKQIRIKTENLNTNLSIDSFENKLIANIAIPYSKNQSELSELYEFGVLKYQEIKSKFDNILLQRFGMWSLRQEMIKFAKQNFTT